MVAIIDNEVVGQQWDLSEWEIPYGVINFQRDFPGATLSIENQSGRVVDVISPVGGERKQKMKDGLQFDEVFCSSCGQGFGPGNEGFSHCEHHRYDALILRSAYHRLVDDIATPGSSREAMQSSALALYEAGMRRLASRWAEGA
jgi:hypothetical protein